MKKVVIATVTVTLATAFALSAAEETEPDPVTQIEQIIKDSATALNANDYQAAFQHLHPTDWSSFGASPQGGVISMKRSDLVGLATAMFPAANVHVSEPTQLKVQVNGDAAVVTYLQTNEYDSLGVQRANTLRVTDVLFKVDGEWQIVHSHQSHWIAM